MQAPAEMFGDLGDRQVVEVAERERGPLVGGQPREGRMSSGGRSRCAAATAAMNVSAVRSSASATLPHRGRR